ncbi:MAG: hypothetical protein LBP28_07400 [Coriobacteriales bacterium]|jgi:hypothetical protein|nr:hypothetical protein [Coriobacteriales bacterium]
MSDPAQAAPSVLPPDEGGPLFDDDQTILSAVQHDPADPVSRLREVVYRQSPHREILYQVLRDAQTRRSLSELEDLIAAYPQFREATQSQYYLIQFLVRGGGLTQYEVAHDGSIVSEEQKRGLDEDGIDDLVAGWAYETTDTGRALVREMAPAQRIATLIDEYPEFADFFVEVLEFLTIKRNFGEVDSLLRNRPALLRDEEAIQPSVFVDKLEKAGAIFWQDGWQTSEGGREYLLASK